MDINLNTIKKVYFIGVGGIGISALAELMYHDGKIISGTNDNPSPVTLDRIRNLGVVINIGADITKISADTDLIVYSLAWDDREPEFMKAVRGLGIPVLTYPQALGLVSANKYTIAISGTHGKTTTTAMVAKVLIEAKLDPTVVVGSLLKDIKSNFIAGQSEYFVVEACEYRRSFLNLNPKILVITNIDSDHLDYYKDLADIQLAFTEMVAKIPAEGYLVCDPSDPKVAPVVATAKCQVVDYRQAKELKELMVPGEHNVRDAQASLAVAEILKVDAGVAEEALNKFAGTWRRFEYKGQSAGGALVYDDYAHHPTEISATIAGARDLMKIKNLTGLPAQAGKLIIAFQPHLYSRTKSLFTEFVDALAGADRVLLAKIYAAREPFDVTVSEEELVKKINEKAGSNIATFISDLVSIEKDLEVESKSGDLVVVMGAGDITLVADRLVGETV
ncbi:MAG: Mur ligase family protein [Candidatus Paceibacterota bacterium]|jgi:UDP-N-acetylmuramate--alanine ligase